VQGVANQPRTSKNPGRVRYTSNTFWAIEKLLGKKWNANGGMWMYKVKWQGKDARGKPYMNSWEPERGDLIRVYGRNQLDRVPVISR
jgi:hypothetical protein